MQLVSANMSETLRKEEAYAFHAHRFWRKADDALVTVRLVFPSNMDVRYLAEDTFQVEMFWLKLRAPKNMPVKLTTLFTAN